MQSFARVAAVLAALALPALAAAQAPGAKGRTVVVKMIDKSATEYVFEPANVTVRPGDVIQFVQTGSMPHNVDFKAVPAGVELGDRKTGPFLSTANETYEITIDKRFTKGSYSYVCTPHEAMGMKGVITVADVKSVAAGGK